MEPYYLCYISGNIAYFTTKDLLHQWGDGWNLKPYTKHSGPPYEPCFHNNATLVSLRGGTFCRCRRCCFEYYENGEPKWKIIKLEWVGDFFCPDTIYGGDCSVDEINNRKVIGWIYSSENWKKPLKAGALITEFTDFIFLNGGTIIPVL